MISGLYSAATAMDVTNRRHEMVSENLANLQTPGYRRRVLSQSSFDTMMQPLQVATDGVDSSKLLGATTGDTQYDFSQGHIQETKLKLDVALNGEGFFTVQSPDGPLYTRSGAFHLDPAGTLVNVDGQPILGIGGPIQVPAGVTTEQIEITNDGSVYANDQQIGQLALVQFADNNTLTAVGASLFTAPPGAVTTGSSAEVLQGRLEMSNTSSVHELINMISLSRHRDAAQKALNTIAESIQKRIAMR
ncbi:MAG: flagellar basal-body rod protein FlgF [Planctomycetales bacterium]|nr:flagellar basal-body rod protein FlgF [Planctomycetales bacterium]